MGRALSGIMRDFRTTQGPEIMEAEQLNAITNKLQDLRARTDELRRYL